MEKFTIPSRCLDVAASADLVVVGGGSAGVAAAIAAARRGCSVILLEKSICAGGMMTNGLLPSIIYMRDGRNLLSGGLCRELVDRTAKAMAVPVNYNWFNIHPEAVKLVLDEMLTEAGVRIFFNTVVCDAEREERRVTAAVVWTPAGLAVVKGRIFVDATGDGNLSALAQLPFELGGEQGQVMAPTLCTLYAGVDFDQVDPRFRYAGMGREEWHAMEKAGTIPVDEHHFVGFFRCGGSVGCGNLGHAYDYRPLEVQSCTQSCIEGRRMARQYLQFFRDNVPGFAKAELAMTASMLGVRESRRIRGEYQLTGDDYRARRHFADDIGSFAYPIDIHASGHDAEEQAAAEKRANETEYQPGENYGIPYRALLACGVENLLLAGRCISCDRQMQSSIRVVPGCMITGEAAGTAAALSLESATPLRGISVPELQGRLARQGLKIR